MNASTNIAQRRRARSLLVQALYQWDIAGSSPESIEQDFRENNAQAKIDWDFFHEVLQAVPAASKAIDDSIGEFLDRKIRELTPVELAVLRLGHYELEKRIDVPYRVVINEYIDLAKKFGASESHKYINGVLDKAARKFRAAEISAGR